MGLRLLCDPCHPHFPASGPATGSFNGPHPKSKFLSENRNLEVAEQIIADLCGNPLTTHVGKPVPQSRNEGVFRIYKDEVLEFDSPANPEAAKAQDAKY